VGREESREGDDMDYVSKVVMEGPHEDSVHGVDLDLVLVHTHKHTHTYTYTRTHTYIHTWSWSSSSTTSRPRHGLLMAEHTCGSSRLPARKLRKKVI
jgi:hypothetical protein